MRKYIFIGLALAGISAFFGCEKDETRTVISSNPTTPSVSGPSAPNGLMFTKDDKDNSIEFTWSAADFGFDASITYMVQLDKDASFSKPTILVSTGDLKGSAKVSDINSALLGMGYEVDVEGTASCRVVAMVSPNTDSAFSSTVDYAVIAYETLIDYPMVYVPGAYQGWAPGDENGRLFSYNFDNTYEGIIRFTGSGDVEFKITPQPNWDNAWGGTLTDGKGTLDPAGSNFKIAAGTYAVTVNTSDLTIELAATDDWGLIGSSIPPYDWSADSNMFYNGQRQMWEITGDLKAGEFKFRANDGWDLNYGSDAADGTLSAGGGNIPLASDGNYTIRMSTAELSYKVTQN
jgi:hypothetical protein